MIYEYQIFLKIVFKPFQANLNQMLCIDNYHEYLRYILKIILCNIRNGLWEQNQAISFNKRSWLVHTTGDRNRIKKRNTRIQR